MLGLGVSTIWEMGMSETRQLIVSDIGRVNAPDYGDVPLGLVHRTSDLFGGVAWTMDGIEGVHLCEKGEGSGQVLRLGDEKKGEM